MQNFNCNLKNRVLCITGCSRKKVLVALLQFKQGAKKIYGALRLELRASGISVFGVYPGPIDTDMAANFDAAKESSPRAAQRVFDGMENGLLDITVDALSDLFIDKLKPDIELIKKLKAHYGC